MTPKAHPAQYQNQSFEERNALPVTKGFTPTYHHVN